jgi:hypothetical protein
MDGDEGYAEASGRAVGPPSGHAVFKIGSVEADITTQLRAQPADQQTAATFKG